MQQSSLFPEKNTKNQKPKATGMMDQYMSIKRQYPETIIFYRMGDFYEMFYDDAIEAAGILNITLTKRGKDGDNPIPMCGVPVHNAELYLRRLIASGKQVTICEQTETPEQAKKRGGSKALVERQAVRMVTAGTLLDDELMDAERVNRLACLAMIRDDWALAWFELAGGTLMSQKITSESLPSILAEIEPNELLIEDTVPSKLKDEIQQNLPLSTQQLSTVAKRHFLYKNCEKLLKDTTSDENIADNSEVEIIAAGVILHYVKHTQIGKIPSISPLEARKSSKNLIIDASTRRNLELSRTLGGEKKGSLLHHIDRCVSANGKRLFSTMLLSPLAEKEKIEHRLDCVSAFYSEHEIRSKLRYEMRNLPDIVRPLSRLQLSHDSPKDVQSIQITLSKIVHIKNLILQSDLNISITKPWQNITLPFPLLENLNLALSEEMPKKLSDGGVIRNSYDETLDHHRSLRDDARRLMMNLQMRLQSETEVDQLKIKFNNMLGYFIEVPERFASKLDPAVFIHRNSIKASARYTTNELMELAREIHAAGNNAQLREEELYKELVEKILDNLDILTQASSITAWLDVSAAMAQLAVDEHFVRPALYDDFRFNVKSARHPVVEKSLKNSAFIANDCSLEKDQRLWLLSGPNMAGKSTFLRQNALIIIMAQMGCFVPAKEAHIGIVDQLFSRVGAADDLARGHSTFMVEMIECAAILNRATPRSFVILDEIGRGTATFDGLSIAWACVEYLHEHNQSRALFATHYHELSEALEDKLSHLKSYHLRVKEWQGDIVFMHEVAMGRAEGSYGVHVAKLAGLPQDVIQRAQHILSNLEKDDLNLDISYSPSPIAQQDPADIAILEQLRAVDADSLSAREALDLIYHIKSQIN